MLDSIFNWLDLHSQGIQALFVSLSVISAVIIYWRTSVNQRRVALVSMILQNQASESVKQATQRMRSLYEQNNHSLKSFVHKNDEDLKAILTVANHYEFMAVAIHQGAFDEDTYKALEYSNVMRNWNVLEDFIKEARATHSNQTWFQDFEKLVADWKKSPLKTVR